MKVKLFGLLALLIPLAAIAQDDPAGKPGQVDHSEISRWGDRVVVSGEGPRDAADVLFSQAMAPPEDDTDQWYVTVWGASTDAATLAIVKGFERDPNLSPFVAAPPPEMKRRAWAHFNFYRADDPTQKWRFEQFGIPLVGPWPVVTIQPPRNGAFGGLVEGKSVVVDKIDAKGIGQPADLRRRITASVAKWCRKLQESGFQPPAKVAERATKPTDEHKESNSHAQTGPTFPWGPQTPPANPQINPQWPAGGPATDPPVTPAPGLPSSNILTLVMALLTGHGTFTDYLLVGGLVIGAILMIRRQRVANGQTPIIGDKLAAVLEQIAEFLKGVQSIKKDAAKDQGGQS